MAITEFRYKITVDGAEQVKQKFAEIQQQIKAGIITGRQSAEETRGMAREGRALNEVGATQVRVFVAAHPALHNLTRTVTLFGSAARTALSITNALNLATLTFSQSSSKVAQIENQIVELRRQKMEAANPGEQKLIDEEILQKERDKTAAAQEFQWQQIQNGLTIVSTSEKAVTESDKMISKYRNVKTELRHIKNRLDDAFSIFTDGTVKSKIGSFLGSMIAGFSRLGDGSIANSLSDLFDKIRTGFSEVKSLESFKGALSGIKAELSALSSPSFLSGLSKIGSSMADAFGGGIIKGEDGSLNVKNLAKGLGGAALVGAGSLGLFGGGIDAITGASDKLEDKLKAIGSVAAIGSGIALAFPEIAKMALIGTAIATATVAIVVFRKEIAGFFGWVNQALGDPASKISGFFGGMAKALGLASDNKKGADAIKQAVDVLTNSDGASLKEKNDLIGALPGLVQKAAPALVQFEDSARQMFANVARGYLDFWNGMIKTTNSALASITSGLQNFVNGFVSAMNAVIKAINATSKVTGVSIPSVAGVTIPIPKSIPFVAAAGGLETDTNGPLLILAGESGKEHISIRPRGSAGGMSSNGLVGGEGGGSAITINVHVAGSIWSKNELMNEIRKTLKSDAKQFGFNGLL